MPLLSSWLFCTSCSSDNFCRGRLNIRGTFHTAQRAILHRPRRAKQIHFPKKSLRTIQRPPSQTWKTFLQNHVGEIVATDFFTVPTVSLRVLFVFIVLEHRRRKVVHFGVSEHPTSQWAAQQMLEAFSERDAPRYLVRDRDGSYGIEFRRRVQSLGMTEILTAPRRPWQNASAERLIGSMRRECLNHVVVLNKWHLRRLLKSYLSYYHCSRTHLALAKDAPESREVMSQSKIIVIPQVGGLHRRYERRAA